jgi:hypothetical protein
MTGNARLIARIALFSALIYVLSWGLTAIPNIKPTFFIIFSAGYLWGLVPGLLVGSIGMGIWTWFNPFGPAPLPVAVAQVAGAMLCGLVGFLFRGIIDPDKLQWHSYLYLMAAGVICTLVFFIPVSATDAWLFQPFRERFITGLLFSTSSLFSNIIIFPLLFRVLQPFYVKECKLR